MMLASRADLEEERRLFYVAMTRAKMKLVLSYAITRYRFGRLKSCEPSRFIDDIEPTYIKMTRSAFPKIENNIRTSSFSSQFSGQYSNNLKKIASKPSKKHVPSPGFKPSDTTGLEKGMKVEHPKFGFGEVIEMDLDGSNKKAKVKFDNFGEKTLLLTFAKLRICI
jgi:DNA helicase-2/ATP-dependent DNA helicase PcrA